MIPLNIKRRVLVFIFALFTIGSCYGQEILPLYLSEIPNSRNVQDTERVVERPDGGRAVFATSVPTLQVFRPENPNGKAIIICPGGGYAKTAIEKEGFRVAERLNRDSLTAFVLKYRIPADTTNVNKSLAPLQDAQQAIRLVREQAERFGVKPDRIGIMGFSAGGHLAATAATQYLRLADADERSITSVRPDFVALVYPVISFTPELRHAGSRENLLGKQATAAEDLRFSAEHNVTADTPPAFLVHAADDRSVPVGNSLAFYAACIEQDIPAEMHLYARGGHGFGLHNGTTTDQWVERLVHWLRTF